VPALVLLFRTLPRRTGARWLLAWGSLVLGGKTLGQDGSLEWAVNLQGWTYSSPSISPDGKTVYVGVTTRTAGRIVALTEAGTERWSVVLKDSVEASPAVAPDGTVYVGSMDGVFHALNPANGSTKWTINTQTFVYSSPAIGADGTVYFGAGDNRLHAVRSDGRERWAFATGDWIDSSPAIANDGTIYFGSWDKNVYAVGSDGVEKWRFATGGKVVTSPAIGVDGTIYIASADLRLYALTPDGTKRWDFLANGEIEASPVLGADGTIYFAANDSNFYALSPENGAVRWRVQLNTNSASTAAIRGDGAIIFGADDGIVRALDARDGSLLWPFDTKKLNADDVIESSPMVAPNGSIYFGSADGRLYKLRGSGSPLSSFSSWPAFRRDAARTGRSTYASNGGRLLNLSSRAQVAPGDTLIAGFAVQGSERRAYLLRGTGPALAQFGVAGYMSDPRLDVYVGQTLIMANDNWGDAEGGFSPVDTAAAIGAFPLPPGSRDAALVPALAPGVYSAHLRSADGGGGVALFETYDASAEPTSRLVNLSLRGKAGAGENTLIAGVVVGGSHPTRLLVRAVGPGLARFGVPGVLARPSIGVYRGSTLLRSNTGWTSEGLTRDLADAAQSVSAFALAPESADCAMILIVDPGLYTIQVSGVGGTVGEVLAEIYVLR
jgi:outer membrane protein assembly factor BamB